MPAAAAPPTDLKDRLEEVRASVAVQETRKGVMGAIDDVILRLVTMLLAMLADFRAGRLAPLAAVAEAVGDGAETTPQPPASRAPPPGSSPGASLCSPSRGEGQEACLAGSGGFAVAGADCGGDEAPVRAAWLGGEAGQWANNAGGGEGAAAGETHGEAEDTRAETRRLPSRCAGRSARINSAGEAELRKGWFSAVANEIAIASLAGWRKARGIRGAFPPCGEMASAEQGRFSKMPSAREREQGQRIVPA
jgi:hypothetical protein